MVSLYIKFLHYIHDLYHSLYDHHKKYVWISVVGFLIALLVLLFFHRIIFIGLLIFLAGALQYATMRNEIKIDIGHVFFLSLLIVRYGGVPLAISFLVLAGFIPQVMMDFEEDMLIMYPIQALVIALSYFLKSFNIVLVGIGLCVVSYGIILLISQEIDEPFPELIKDLGIPFVLNIIYFTAFSDFFMGLLKVLIGN
jgi:hypothetical protein